MSRVLCLGDVMLDVTARLSGPLHVGSDTPAQIRWVGGGSAANTACWLAEAGADAVFVGRVGDDEAGRWSLDELARHGVRLATGTDANLATGTCLVLIDRDGERTMVPDTGANAALSPSDVDAAELSAGDHLHVSGYALFHGARPAALHAMRRAREVGATVSVGAASSAPLREVGAAAFLSWVGTGALVIGNADEAQVLTGETDALRAATALASQVGEAVVTLGAAGAVWSDGTRTQATPAVAVRVIDSTGAGDTFLAGFLAARARGAGVEQAMAAAADLAAQACVIIGARPIGAQRR